MLKNILNRKGQNMAEYAIIFGVVIAAAVGVSALIKQGVQNRVVREVSKIGDTEAAGTTTFDIQTNTTRSSTGNEDISVAAGGAVTETKSSSGNVTASETYNVGQ